MKTGDESSHYFYFRYFRPLPVAPVSMLDGSHGESTSDWGGLGPAAMGRPVCNIQQPPSRIAAKTIALFNRVPIFLPP